MKKEYRKLAHTLLIEFRIISVIIIIVCLILIFRWYKENQSNTNLADNLINQYYEEVAATDTETAEDNQKSVFTVNFEELLNNNPDTVGWIKIDNTNINFPIVKGADNNAYLKHNFDNEYNSAGWIFADYQNSFPELDTNTIIFGHNRLNGTMFSNLSYFLDTSWYNDNQNRSFDFLTTQHSYTAQIYSVYKIKASDIIFSNNFENQMQFEDYINTTKEKSVFDFGVDITLNDKILTLCTCDSNTQYRIIVQAKLVENY